MAVGGDDEAGLDHDVMWRRGGPTQVGARPQPVPSAMMRDSTSDVSASDVSPVSPWSREAVEAPVPSIGEIRDRWRAELGLDDDDGRRASAPLVSPFEEDDDAPASTSSGDLVLGAVATVLLLCVAVAVAWALRPPAPAATASIDRLPVVGETPTWSVETDAPVTVPVVAAGVVVSMVGDELVVRELDDGEVRWTRTPPGPGGPTNLTVLDDVVVFSRGASVGVAAGAFDLETGAPLWERLDSTETSVLTLPAGVVEIAGSGAGEPVARVIDPTTGEPVGAGLVLRKLNVPDGYLLGLVADDLALLDLAAGEVLTPAVPSFGLAALAPVGDAVVGFTAEADIVAFGADGVATDQRPFVSDAFGDFAGRAELVGGVPGTSIGVVASGTSLGFELVDGRIEPRWELDGRVLGPIVETETGPLALARLVDADTGRVQFAVVDVVGGDIVAITNSDGDREDVPQLLADGYVVAPAVGDPDRVVRAFGYDGVERWSVPIGQDAIWFLVGDGRLLVLDDAGLSAYG